jgi:hypothetical protein
MLYHIAAPSRNQKRSPAALARAARDGDLRFSRYGRAMNAATRKANPIEAKAPSSSQPANAKGSARFSAYE